MSQENVELVQSILATWERGDFSAVDWAHPEIEYAIVGGPSPGSWTGVASMVEASAILNAWERYRMEASEYRELDGGRAIVLFHAYGRGKTSGVELGQVQAKGAGLFHVRDGKVTSYVHCFDRERALADLGLSE